MDHDTKTCNDYVSVNDEKMRRGGSSLISAVGTEFCGQQLPNYPGPSVIMSGKLYYHLQDYN